MLYEQIDLTTSAGETVRLDAYCPDLGKHLPQDLRRTGVIVCGGGGYAHVSDRESEPVALRFVTMGFNAYVLHYRVAPYRYPSALHDLGSAVAWVRRNADRLHNHPDRIAVLGFSAGGHLCGSLGNRWADAALWTPLELTPGDVRPNAQVLCYPVITAGEFAHRDSFVKLTGTDDPSVHALHSLEDQVGSQTPPTFLWSTWTDGGVPCENTLLMAGALRRAHIPGEVHIFPYGHHGLSLADETTWGGDPIKLEKDCSVWAEMAGKFLQRNLER